MAEFHIYVGYRTVSSWSLRGWLPMKKAGVAFDETLIRYRTPEGRAELDRLSPTGKVPFLVHARTDGRTVKVWDSLAIAEYLAETVPDARLWPEDPAARAQARAVSGGDAFRLRGAAPAFRHGALRAPADAGRSAGAQGCRAHPGDLARLPRDLGQTGGGPFLFGRWSIADAAYAPVATRFRTYGLKPDAVCRRLYGGGARRPGLPRLGDPGAEGCAAGAAAAVDPAAVTDRRDPAKGMR